MQRRPNLQTFLCCLMVYILSCGHAVVRPLKAAPQPQVGALENPCDHLPAPPGLANGIDMKCLPRPSSSGIAKADFNGDGFADLAIGISDQTVNDVTTAGAVIVMYGSANGLTTNTSGIPLPQTWTESNTGLSTSTGDHFGLAVAAGDFNGDGYSDLAILKPGTASTIVVLHGSPSGLVSLPGNSFPICHADSAGALAWGDFNGDGFGDLMVGCVFQASLNVIPGSKEGLDLNHRQFFSSILPSTFGTPVGLVLAPGDFNGDGRTDVAIGVPNANIPDTSGGCVANCNYFSKAGLVAVMYGSSTGIVDLPPQIWYQGASNICCQAEQNAHFGASLAVGDFNGDGKKDLAIGAPRNSVSGVSDAGTVVIIYGSSGGLTSNGNQIWNENTVGGVARSNEFGFALAAGDFNGDGRADLAIGIPFEDVNTALGAGQVAVVYGSPSGLSTSGHPAQFWHQGSPISGSPQQNGHFGFSLSAWNFGRNDVTFAPVVTVHETADLAIGSPNYEVSRVLFAGAINVIYGSFLGNGLIASNNQLFFQGSPFGLSSDHFGSTMY